MAKHKIIRSIAIPIISLHHIYIFYVLLIIGSIIVLMKFYVEIVRYIFPNQRERDLIYFSDDLIHSSALQVFHFAWIQIDSQSK